VKAAVTCASCVLGLALASCGDPGQLGRSVVSPSDVTAHVALTNVPVHGAEIKVERIDGDTLHGELLAASDDEMTLLTSEGVVLRVPVDSVKRAIVTRYENGGFILGLTLWSIIGGLGEISHGVLLIASEPIWGAISAGAIVPVAADAGRFAYAERRSDFTFMHEYARFPQGLPPAYKARARGGVSPAQ
jgi:hypothetical protein